MTIVSADTFDLVRLAAVFEAGYEGYFVPIHVNEAALGWMVGTWDIDLAKSRVALQDGEPVGIVMLGVRGERGWIGGLGVAASARRAGVGRALMEAVLAEAPPVVGLEVIEQNEPAIKLYEDLGFERTRILEVWSLTAEVPDREVRVAEPHPLGQDALPWQLADESLPDGYERIEVDGGAALIRVGGDRVSLLQLVADSDDAAAALVAAARNRGASLHYVNVPEGDPAAAALAALGGKLDLRQFEYRLDRAS